MIYFDHNSTAPYSPSVREFLSDRGFLESWYNPSSIYPQAQILDQNIKESRRVISEHLNCSPKDLFFTSGGTESINTILSAETLKLNNISRIISSELEHHATLRKIEHLIGFFYPNHLKPQNQIQYIPILSNDQGEIRLDKLEEKCFKHPYSLVSLLSANNETGVITNIPAVSKIARKSKCLVHVDAVQSLGKEFIDLEKWDVDFASFSGHKIGAMKGVGLLYARKPFAPLLSGGGQERHLRAGTYNYPAIQSFKLAVQDIDLNKMEYVKNLRDRFEELLLPKNSMESFVSPFKVNCQQALRLPNTSNIYCGGIISNQAILLDLAQKGIGVSAGSACSAGSALPSHVMTQIALCMARPKDYANSCIRVSLSHSNTKEEVDFLVSSLKERVLNLSSSQITARP